MRYKFLKTKSQKSQKSRKISPYTSISVESKHIKLVAKTGGRFEFIYLFFIKKFFKHFFPKKKKLFRLQKILFFCPSNLPLSKKSKNARMGSGKGYFLRWAIKIKKHGTLVKSTYIPYCIIIKLARYWNLRLPYKVVIC